MRVIFAGGGTGGHLFPGLAVAREFQRRDRMTEILFMGTTQGIEHRVLPKEGYRLETLPVRGLKGRGLRGALDALYGVPASLLRSLKIMRDFRPDCVIGLGGYASGPALLAAKLAGVRAAIMEQNLRPGFTNKLLSRWVDRVFTGYPGSAAFFPGARVVESGNPVRWQKLPDVEKRAEFSVLIFGGSLGARRINFAVVDALKQLIDLKAEIFIMHQTGELDFAAVRAAYDALPFSAEVTRFIDKMDEAYARADLIVCRAGATTTAELIAAGKASIMVPFPFAADDHQRKNAEALEAAGAARMILQEQLSGDRLVTEIQKLVQSPEELNRMEEASRKLAHGDAAAAAVDMIEELIT